MFSKIDLKPGYWKVPIYEVDIPKTTFRVHWVLFKFLVMPFGVTNAPLKFMHFGLGCSTWILDVFVVIFIDDILVYSRNIEEHT